MTQNEMTGSLLAKLYEETMASVKEAKSHEEARAILANTVNTFAFMTKQYHGAMTGPVKLDGKALGKAIEEATRHRPEAAAKIDEQIHLMDGELDLAAHTTERCITEEVMKCPDQ